jgi:hypothetical protein
MEVDMGWLEYALSLGALLLVLFVVLPWVGKRFT